MMPFLEIHYVEQNICCHYWQSGKYFFRQYDTDSKPKRISEQEYMSAYELANDL